jgi:eukaryotic-like serine/threonine-protein kinase
MNAVTLTAGKVLGPYEIVSLIGAGGMGEVYRARDPRLGREVAIKILPAQFSADSERLRRFEQEARAAGMLNHPNILAIHDIGTTDDTVYVVSELLTGETLRERMGGSPLPVRKAVEYALQISHGLGAAHEKGIVHRDLKPENIFLTQDGRVKILDFGLAKLTDQSLPQQEQSRMQTMDPNTRPGVVLGTVGYMSPEQVRGRVTDHRSDIFSFGAILYEMLSGKRAFQRDSGADSMSAILKEDPPELSGINSNIPPSLQRVVHHCLEKNPEERFQSARDLAFDLEMISDASGTSPMQPAVESKSPKLLRWIAAILLFLGSLTAAYFVGRQSGIGANPHRKAASETDFKRLTYRRGYVSAARFAPDGQSVIYSAAWVGSPEELFMTRPQNPVSRPLGIADAALLSISSTGEMAILLKPRFTVGWQKAGTLARLPMDGGAPREVLKDVQDADWAADGKSFAVAHFDSGKFRLEFPIGKVLYESPGWIGDVRISPDGKLVGFTDHPTVGDDRGVIAIVDLNGKVKKLTNEFASESGLKWSHDGKEIWFTASTEGSNEQPIYAVNLQGQQRVVAAMVGNLILQDIDSKGNVLLTRDSRRREIVALPPGETRERDMSWFDWSFCRDLTEDGKLLLFEEQGAGGGPNYSVFLRNTDGSPAVKLGDGYALSLSPDRNFVVSMLPSDSTHLTLLPTGAGETKTLTSPGFSFNSASPKWFSDGNRIVVAGHTGGRPSRWWIYDLRTHKVTPITPEGVFGWTNVLLTPDEKYLLAEHLGVGFSLFPVDGGPSKKVPGLEPGSSPIQWTADGKGVFVADGRQIPVKISRVDLETGKQTIWKEITPADQSGIAGQISVLITPDGQSYAYTYRRVLSDLYLVPGLQ